jgi:hypothetical protein
MLLGVDTGQKSNILKYKDFKFLDLKSLNFYGIGVYIVQEI